MPSKRVSAKGPASQPRTSFFSQPLILLVLIVAMAAAALYLLLSQPKAVQQAGQRTAVPVAKNEDMQKEVEGILQKVARHVLVNPNEAPYIATITNIELVRQNNPVFYKDADEGDKVLIWSDKAIVYSPARDIIISMMTSIPQDTVTASSTASVPAEETSIEIRNGSRVTGAASRLRTTLKGLGMTVAYVGDAGSVYETTQIVDLSGGSAPRTVSALSSALPGSEVIMQLPDAEVSSKAQVLIIIGKDRTL